MKKFAARAAYRLLAVVLAAMLAACAGKENFAGGPGAAGPEATAGAAQADNGLTLSQPDYQRTPPPVQLAEMGGAVQQVRDDGGRNGIVDTTNASKGYVGVVCNASVQARVRIIKDEAAGEIDDYDIDTDGTPSFYPFSRGNGVYTVILYVFLEETPQGPSYERFLVSEVNVALESEFAPFLVPSRLMNYSESSACVSLSYEITQHCATDLEVVQQIYSWIAKNVKYDQSKAEQVASGVYFEAENPDITIQMKSGICYDYAALAGSMLRANGIPTKLVKGDVFVSEADGWVFHAWNVVWLKETGWIAVELAADPNDWSRIDTTFAAAGTGMGRFIGDGSNYTPISEH